MGESHTPANDVVYDLISIQHAEVQQEDSRRAVRAHELLGKLTKHGLS